MFEKVILTDASRDWKKAFEILPGPAAINPQMSPTPFSNKIGVGAGKYNLLVLDPDDKDSEDSRNRVNKVNIQYKRPNGTMFRIDDIDCLFLLLPLLRSLIFFLA